MIDFTKNKFIALSVERRHKKCAELLRILYQQRNQQEWSSAWQMYQQYLQWMDLPSHSAFTLKTIADQYHWHLKQAKVFHKEHSLLPHVRQGDRLFCEEKWPIAIYLDHLRSAHNVGSIIRTVEALSLGEVYFSHQTPFITHKQVQNTSMGSFQFVTCHRDFHFEDLPRPIIIFETCFDAASLFEFVFPPSFTIIVGNEEYGCSDEILKSADNIIEIPLRGRKNSLNVANAFAIAAGEITRQKYTNK